MPRLPFVDPTTLPPDKRAALEFTDISMKFIVSHATDTFIPIYQAVGALRESPDLDPMLRQFVILGAAAATDSEFIWTQHAHRTVALGVSEERVEAVRRREPLPGREGIVLAFLDQLFEGGHPGDEDVARVLEVISVRALVEAVLQYGLYVTFARLGEAADMPPDPPRKPAQWDRLSTT